jgi:hypothetical protein
VAVQELIVRGVAGKKDLTPFVPLSAGGEGGLRKSLSISLCEREKLYP